MMIRMFGFGTSSNRYDNGFRVSLLSCGNGTLAACCPCPRRGSACVAMGDLDEDGIDGSMGPGLNDEVTTLFMTKRHGTDLPTKLIKVIVSYYLDVLEVDSMEEIEHDDPNEMEEAAKDAYASAMGKELPLPYIYRMRKWAGEVQLRFNTLQRVQVSKRVWQAPRRWERTSKRTVATRRARKLLLWGFHPSTARRPSRTWRVKGFHVSV